MRDRPGTIPAPGGLALLLTLTALAPPAPAGAQGRWIDIGSGVGFTITVEGEPESRALFPPYAFGTFSPGNYVYLELLLWPCSGLPDPEVCAGATFVRAFQSYLDTGTCPCTGVLFAPIALELRYDPAGSGRWGRARKTFAFSCTTRTRAPGWNSPASASSRIRTSSWGVRPGPLASSSPSSSSRGRHRPGGGSRRNGRAHLETGGGRSAGAKAAEQVRRRKPGRIDPCSTDGREGPGASPGL